MLHSLGRRSPKRLGHETDQGWLYLATVMDLYSRRIVGWAMQDHLRADLPLAALKMAISAQWPAPGLIPPSDRGVQKVSQGDAVSRLQGLDEPQGRLPRQCPDGELLPHAQNRARSSPAICNTNRSHDIFAYLTSTIERVVTPPSAISARSRWS